ncbi:transmembrane protease serine 2-like isoform X1 [Acipenser ruthenus]|uniref:transmembrane protease serine 2-like isoform X1 n=1 Tax=Acipenser ruthenus TaxID=7906 RepID=UPI002741DF8F|nr:transmembrane protease serine 2-like isoform X1 [Acipenser ruthenus]
MAANPHSGPYYINYGFQQGQDLPPPYNLAAGAPPPPYLPQHPPSAVPQYSPSVPTHIPTPQRYLQDRPASSGRRTVALALSVVGVLLILGVTGFLIWYFGFIKRLPVFESTLWPSLTFSPTPETVSSSCMFGVPCGSSGSCVSSSKWCDGTPDCPLGEDEETCLRLYGSNFLLQAYSPTSQSWKPVCADYWSDSYGKSSCEQIGYSRDTYLQFGKTSQISSGSSGFMKLDSGLSNTGGKLQNMLTSSNWCSTGSVVTLRCIGCGVKSTPSTRIIGGTVAQVGEWPWQVSLQINKHHICGGTIITPYWIVTAAHCVETYSHASYWTVVGGFLTLTEMQTVPGSSVSLIIANKNYNSQTKDNDIALMKLTRPLAFSNTVKPVCLPNVGLQAAPSSQYWISGWGASREGGASTEDLLMARVNAIGRDTCNSAQVYNGLITKAMICAGVLQGGVDSCQGDSGGPLVTQENSLWWLMGDTSWGYGCAQRNKPGVYGNVTYFLDWIYHQMQTNR